MPNDTRKRLLNEISNLSTDDVVALLRKNKLSECCDAVVKRQVDGEGLLHLSEGNLNLWKRDLTTSLRRSLCRFVAELHNNPEQYFEEENRPTSPPLSTDASNEGSVDSDAWDTDFEDGEPSILAGEDSEDSDDGSDMYRNGNSRPQSKTSPGISGNGASRLAHEGEENDNLYSNGMEPINSIESAVSPRAGNDANMVAQLKERLQLQMERRKPPTTGPKPKLMEKTQEVIELVRNRQPLLPPQQPFRPKTNAVKPMPTPESVQNIGYPKMEQSKKYSLPPKPMNASRIVPTRDEKPRDLPKPPSNPLRLGNLDLVADLPPDKGDDSDGCDYEPIEGQPMEQQYQGSGSMKSAYSTQSLGSARSIRGSNESVHHPQITNSVEDSQEVYEVISEKPNDHDSYVEPIGGCLVGSKTLPWTVPSRPSHTNSLPKRSEPKPYATFPNISQSKRPLPPPPISDSEHESPVEPPEINFDVPSYMKRPWYHNIGREEAIALIEGASSKSSTAPPDGYFLVRPSNANMNQPWTLVLWYRNKTFNIPVRKRPDSRYALGKVKPNEVPFASIEEMINFYKQKELVLNSGSPDAQVGKTRLTETPPKKRD